MGIEIKRFAVSRNGKNIGYGDTLQDAHDLIAKGFLKKKNCRYSLTDLESGSEVDIGLLLSSLMKTPKPKKMQAKSRTKSRANSIIDDDYSRWLGEQKCVVTGQCAKRGVGMNAMHCHHIHGRSRGRNDHMQVPLMGFVHSWGPDSYHYSTRSDFKKKWNLQGVDVIEFFEQKAREFLEIYKKEGKTLKKSKNGL